MLFSKEKEIGGLQQNVEDQASEIAALQRKVRELEARIEELEEDLDSERNSKNRVSMEYTHAQALVKGTLPYSGNPLYIHASEK